MLAYAPHRDQPKLSPAALTLIIAGHAAALALVMTARSGEIFKSPFHPTIVTLIPEPAPPPPEPKPQPNPQPSGSHFTAVDPLVPPLPGPGPIADPTAQPLPQPGHEIGTGITPTPIPLDPPLIRTGPRFITAANDIRPPYPDSKRVSGDEASLRLKLSIDERGRVIAVVPVGRVDLTFFETARRHILRAWHYQPAMEGSKAVPSVTTITLRFELGAA